MSEVSLDSLYKERPAPLWGNDGSQAFDYHAIDHSEDAETTEKNLAEALAILIRWLHQDGSARNLKSIGMRVIALAWLLEPKATGAESASDIAKRLGVNRHVLHRHMKDASKRFGITSRFQAHSRRKKKP